MFGRQANSAMLKSLTAPQATVPGPKAAKQKKSHASGHRTENHDSAIADAVGKSPPRYRGPPRLQSSDTRNRGSSQRRKSSHQKRLPKKTRRSFGKGNASESSDDEPRSPKDDEDAPCGAPAESEALNDDGASSSSLALGSQEPPAKTCESTLESKCAALRISAKPSGAIDVSEYFPLMPELVMDIFGRLDWRYVMQLLVILGHSFRDLTHHPSFLRSRPIAEAEFSPVFFQTDDNGDLQWLGFDTKLRTWTTLPPLNFNKKYLPPPDPDLFKDYLVAGDGGLLCLNVGKSTGREQLVVCNALTKQVKVLPPLKYSRHPVLMHIKVDALSGHYRVVVAGSAAIGTEDLSLKTEEYDSRSGMWECFESSDLPCPQFGLNEYQNAVYFTDGDRELLLCVAIVDTRGRGVLVYDLKKKKWEQSGMDLHIPLVQTDSNIGHLATTQIVECGGAVYVFSEQECGREVFFLIHKLNLEISEFESPGHKPWTEILRRKRAAGRGLLVYPEYTCVPVSHHELCIFNTVEHTMEVIDPEKPTEVAPLRPAPRSAAIRFHSLNPISFVFKPSFRSLVCPRGLNPRSRCDLEQREYCSECVRRGNSSQALQSCGSHIDFSNNMINTRAPTGIAEPDDSDDPDERVVSKKIDVDETTDSDERVVPKKIDVDETTDSDERAVPGKMIDVDETTDPEAMAAVQSNEKYVRRNLPRRGGEDERPEKQCAWDEKERILGPRSLPVN